MGKDRNVYLDEEKRIRELKDVPYSELKKELTTLKTIYKRQQYIPYPNKTILPRIKDVEKVMSSIESSLEKFGLEPEINDCKTPYKLRYSNDYIHYFYYYFSKIFIRKTTQIQP